MALIDFGGEKEEVIMRAEFPMAKARQVLKAATFLKRRLGRSPPSRVLFGQGGPVRVDWRHGAGTTRFRPGR